MNNRRQKIISVLSLLNVMFVPIFDGWGGLFPSDPDDDFFEILGFFFSGEGWDYWSFIFTMPIFIASLLMAIFAFFRKSKTARTCAWIGLIVTLFNLLSFARQSGISEVLNAEDGSICIGLWVALGLFIAMTVKKNKPEEQKNDNENRVKNDITAEQSGKSNNGTQNDFYIKEEKDNEQR